MRILTGPVLGEGVQEPGPTRQRKRIKPRSQTRVIDYGDLKITVPRNPQKPEEMLWFKLLPGDSALRNLPLY